MEADTEQLAEAVLASVRGLSPDTVAALAYALQLAGPPLAAVGFAFDFVGGQPDQISGLRMRRALRRFAVSPERDELLAQLAEVEDEPWRSLGDAVLALSETA